jgi:hypothetical protein
MRDPSVKFPETFTDSRGVERVVGFAAPNYTPPPEGLTDRQKANAARRDPQPAFSSPIIPSEHPHREATT